jgi:hypothetical protein
MDLLPSRPALLPMEGVPDYQARLRLSLSAINVIIEDPDIKLTGRLQHGIADILWLQSNKPREHTATYMTGAFIVAAWIARGK